MTASLPPKLLLYKLSQELLYITYLLLPIIKLLKYPLDTLFRENAKDTRYEILTMFMT